MLRETPAESSGLRSGDLLVAFRDLPVVDTRSLLRLIASAPVGETVIASPCVRLDEGRRRISVRLGVMPEPVAADRVAAEFRFFVREPEPQPEIGGARPSVVPSVSGVAPGSQAARAGVKVGDRGGGGQRPSGGDLRGPPRRAPLRSCGRPAAPGAAAATASA